MTKKIASIGLNGLIAIFTVMGIVVYVNFYKSVPAWHLVWYLQFYFIVGYFIYINFKITKNAIVHCLVVALGLYYLYEITMDIYKIFDESGWDKLYRKKTINYIVALGIGIGLLINPIWKLIVKWLKKLLKAQ